MSIRFAAKLSIALVAAYASGSGCLNGLDPSILPQTFVDQYTYASGVNKVFAAVETAQGSPTPTKVAGQTSITSSETLKTKFNTTVNNAPDAKTPAGRSRILLGNSLSEEVGSQTRMLSQQAQSRVPEFAPLPSLGGVSSFVGGDPLLLTLRNDGLVDLRVKKNGVVVSSIAPGTSQVVSIDDGDVINGDAVCQRFQATFSILQVSGGMVRWASNATATEGFSVDGNTILLFAANTPPIDLASGVTEIFQNQQTTTTLPVVFVNLTSASINVTHPGGVSTVPVGGELPMTISNNSSVSGANVDVLFQVFFTTNSIKLPGFWTIRSTSATTGTFFCLPGGLIAQQ